MAVTGAAVTAINKVVHLIGVIKSKVNKIGASKPGRTFKAEVEREIEASNQRAQAQLEAPAQRLPPPEAPGERLVTDLAVAPRRVARSGQFVGAPAGINTGQKLAGLHRKLINLAESAVQAVPTARFWYERSGRAILELTGGNVDQAEKFALLLASLSRANPVENNFSAALRIWNQHSAGGKISAGRFPAKDFAEHLGIMTGQGDFTGLKRTAFFANLMRAIDPSRVPKGLVTVDLHIMRAFGYKTAGKMHVGKSVADTQNEFVQKQIQDIARELGWEPQQLQAAIWVAQKSKTDLFNKLATAIRGTAKKQKWSAERLAETLALKERRALARKAEPKQMQKSKFDFGDAIERARAQMNWEAIPHPDHPETGWIFGLGPRDKAAYHHAAAQTFLDDTGADLIAKGLGFFHRGDFTAPGAFEGGVQPGAVQRLIIPGQISAKPGARIDANTKLLFDVAAGLRGALLRQKGIGWHRPFYSTSLVQADSIEIRIGRSLTMEETDAVYKKIVELGGHIDFAPISTARGFSVFNGDWTGIENKKMHELVRQATAEAIEPDFKDVVFRREGSYLERDVKGDPDGQAFRNIASKAGRPDLQRRVDLLYETIGSRLDDLDAEYAAQSGRTQSPRRRTAPPETREQVDASREFKGDEGRAPEPGGQLDLFSQRARILGNHGLSPAKVDQEGRALVAKYIAGVREVGGPDVALNNKELVTVAYALADRGVKVVPEAELGGATGAVVAAYSRATDAFKGQELWISDSQTARALFDDPDNFQRWMGDSTGARKTFGHETGHLIDNLNRRLIGREGGFRVARFVRNEMRALSRILRPHLWQSDAALKSEFGQDNVPWIRRYRDSTPELFADSISFYFSNPVWVKAEAPRFAKLIRGTVNDNERLRNIIQFNQVAAVAGLGTMFAGDQDDDRDRDRELQVAGVGGILKAVRAGAKAARIVPPPPGAGPMAGRVSGVMRVRPASEGEAAFFLSELKIDPNKIPVELDITNIKTIEDLDRARIQMMEALAPQIEVERRGVVKNAVTLQMAQQLDILPQILQRRIGETMNATEITATRLFLEQSRAELDGLALRIRGSEASEREAFEFRRRMALHAVIQMQFLGARAEIGRALQSFQIDLAGGSQAMDARISELLTEFGGLKTTKQIAERWLDINDPAQKNKLALKGFGSRSEAAFFEVWINGLLSGPFTHVRNTVGNTLFQAWSIPEYAVAAGIGGVRAGLTGPPLTDRVFSGEVAARSYGVLQGFKEGFALMARSLRNGQPLDPLGKLESMRYRAISAEAFNLVGPTGQAVDLLGSVIRVPGTFLMGMDELYKGVAGRMELNQIAYHKAMEAYASGATQEEAANIAMAILRNPPDDIKMSVLAAQRYYTFTDEPEGKLADAIKTWQRIPMVGRLVMPFRRTPINLVKRFLERTPAAPAMPSVRKALAAGGAERDLALARMALGSAAIAVASGFAVDGFLTGAGPENRAQRSMLRKTGWQPWSFRVKKGEGWISDATLATLQALNAVSQDKDHIYISYLGIEPIGNFLAISTSATDAMKWSEEYSRNEDFAGDVLAAVSESQLDRSFFQGMSNLSEALVYGPGAFNNYISRLASSMKPFSSLLRSINRLNDRTLRDTRVDPDVPIGLSQFFAALNGFKNGTPGLSKTLPAFRNIVDGREVKLGEGNWFEYVNPFYISVRKYSPVERELTRLKVPFGYPSRKIAGVGLNPHQVDRLVQLIGAEVSINGVTHKEALLGLIDTTLYQDKDDEQKKIMMRNLHDDYVKGAVQRLAGLTRFKDNWLVDIGAAEDTDLALKLQASIEAMTEQPPEPKILPPF
jgi:hypothetical protein